MITKLCVTGGIGSGKTEICRIFSALGAPVYHADERAKDLLNNDVNLKRSVVSAFGEHAYSGSVYNRKYIASVIFNSGEKLRELNHIVHPAVRLDFQQWLKTQQYPYAVIETAIPYESGFDKLTDHILLVDAPVELRIKRACERDQLTPEEVKKRIEKQMPAAELRKNARWIVLNDDQTLVLPRILEVHQFLLQNPAKEIT